jgi:enoyl-CoA hydratase/carnithine racemase
MADALYERRDRLAIITLNRPQALNALTLSGWQDLRTAYETFRTDSDAWVAIITGAGDRAFCVGSDLKEMRAAAADGGKPDPFWQPEPLDAGQMRQWKPVIAAINGLCLAGGLELALACDIRLCVPQARFGLPEVSLGLIPGAGGTQRLPRLVPFGIALQLMLTGDQIDAVEAHRIGLVNAVVPADRLMAEAEALAGRIAMNAPLSTRAVKEAAYLGQNASLEDGLRIEAFLYRIIRTTEDSREGPRAFTEKRPARFMGR